MTVIATAGHVDHGKSSLVRALTGINPDRLAEEQQRGMTIDLGFAHTVTADGHLLSFIDVPGHVDFIRNMIAGVSHVGVVLLVVDAGEGWMPQTSEHCDVVSLLGSSNFVVAITKSDRVEPVRIQQVESDIRTRLADRGIEQVDVVATSIVTGEGIQQLQSLLVDRLRIAANEQRSVRMRLFVDRVFTMKGSGTVATGTLEGDVRSGEQLHVVRGDKGVRIRGIQVHGHSVDSAVGPTRVALNLTGITTHDIARGDVLVRPHEWRETTQCDVQLRVLGSLDHHVGKRGQYMFHVGTSDQETQVRLLKADDIAPGHIGIARLTFVHALPLLPGDRFVLRETGRGETVGGGVVLDAHPVLSVSKASPDGTLQTYLQERGWMTVSDVQRETGFDVEAVAGEWIAPIAELHRVREQLDKRLNTSPEGIDVSLVDPWERELLAQFKDVVISHGVARRGYVLSPEEQRVDNLVRNSGLTGCDASQLPRDVMRRLVHQQMVYEHDGIAFHVDVLEQLRDVLRILWNDAPDGFTMAALRDATGLTRKFSVPLGTVLDKRGLTKRVGDVRVPGPQY
jgi:selenocysteine-specific elongation factor